MCKLLQIKDRGYFTAMTCSTGNSKGLCPGIFLEIVLDGSLRCHLPPAHTIALGASLPPMRPDGDNARRTNHCRQIPSYRETSWRGRQLRQQWKISYYLHYVKQSMWRGYSTASFVRIEEGKLHASQFVPQFKQIIPCIDP